MMAEREDQAMQMAQQDTELDGRGGMIAGHGLQDEEEEKRLFVQQEDGEEKYRAVLRAAEKQVARRMRSHAASMTSDSRQHGHRATTSQGIAYMDIETSGEVQPERQS